MRPDRDFPADVLREIERELDLDESRLRARIRLERGGAGRDPRVRRPGAPLHRALAARLARRRRVSPCACCWASARSAAWTELEPRRGTHVIEAEREAFTRTLAELCDDGARAVRRASGPARRPRRPTGDDAARLSVISMPQFLREVGGARLVFV